MKTNPLGDISSGEQLPRCGEHVIVYCRQFQCLGYYDSDEKWRNAYSREVLCDVEGWCRLNEDRKIPVHGESSCAV